MGLRGRQGVLAEVAQRVVAAFEEFAREREARSVTADPLGGLQVVLAVGAARMPRLLRGLIQRPAQRGRPLAAQMPGRAVLVGLFDGDVQAAVADDVTGVLKPAGVAELGEDRDRRQLADAVDLIDQRPAAGLLACIGAQREIERGELQVDRVDHLKRDRELLARRARELQGGKAVTPGAGFLLALWSVAAIDVIGGQTLLCFVNVSTVRKVTAVVLLALAAYTAYLAAR